MRFIIAVLALSFALPCFAGERVHRSRPNPKLPTIPIYAGVDLGVLRPDAVDVGGLGLNTNRDRGVEFARVDDRGVRFERVRDDRGVRFESIRDDAKRLERIHDEAGLKFERVADPLDLFHAVTVDRPMVAIVSVNDNPNTFQAVFDVAKSFLNIKDDMGLLLQAYRDAGAVALNGVNDTPNPFQAVFDEAKSFLNVKDDMTLLFQIDRDTGAVVLKLVKDDPAGFARVNDAGFTIRFSPDPSGLRMVRVRDEGSVDDIFKRSSEAWLTNHRKLQAGWKQSRKRVSVKADAFRAFHDDSVTILNINTPDADVGTPRLLVLDTDRYGRVGKDWGLIIERVKPEVVVLNWTHCLNMGHDYSQTWEEVADNLDALDGFVKKYSPNTMTFTAVLYGTRNYRLWSETMSRVGDGVALTGPALFPSVNVISGIKGRLGIDWRDADGKPKPVLWAGFIGEAPRTATFDVKIASALTRMAQEGFYGAYVSSGDVHESIGISAAGVRAELALMAKLKQEPNNVIELSRLIAENTGMPFVSAYRAVSSAFPNAAVDEEQVVRLCQFGEELDADALSASWTLEWFVKEGVNRRVQPAAPVLTAFLSEGGIFRKDRLSWAAVHTTSERLNAALPGIVDRLHPRAILQAGGAYPSALDEYGRGEIDGQSFLSFINRIKERAEIEEGDILFDAWRVDEYPRIYNIVSGAVDIF